MKPAIKFNGTNMWCDIHRAIHPGEQPGYLYNGKAMCLEEYIKIFPKFKEAK